MGTANSSARSLLHMLSSRPIRRRILRAPCARVTHRPSGHFPGVMSVVVQVVTARVVAFLVLAAATSSG